MTAKIRVLIVDDEDRFRETTAAILERRGFEVQAVASGTEAIAAIKKDKIDVVVLDLRMPGMDGNAALREIRKIKPDIAALMLTGHGSAESALQGLHEGLLDYLTKPCSIDFLAQKIREAYGKGTGVGEREPNVRQAMVPPASFRSVREDQTVGDAVRVMLEGLTQTSTTSTVQETVHHSILVRDGNDRIVDIMSYTELLQGLEPSYMRLLTEKPAMANSIHVEPPNFSGMFTIMARDLATKTVRDIMAATPPVIGADANLMEAANKLLMMNAQRLLVSEDDQIIGVIRRQDLFFELTNIIRRYAIPTAVEK